MRCKMIAFTAIVAILAYSSQAFSYTEERRGHLGIGFSNQLKTDVPSISLKVHKGKNMALGGLFGINTGDNGGYGVGAKMYNLIYDEPQLNFYLSFMGALINDRNGGTDNTGFQTDLTLGSEFSFSGLESIGFSFEFGISINKINEVVIETAAQHFVTAGVHFYM